VEHLGVLPVEVLIEEPLALRRILEVDATDDVGDSEQVVVDSRLEVQQGPTPVLAGFLAGVWRVNHPEGDPVPERWVLVLDIGPDSEDNPARRVLAVDHRVELLAGFLTSLLAVGTRFAVVFECRELFGGTGAGVRAAVVDQCARVLVVRLHPIGGAHHLVGLESEVLDRVEDRVVGVEIGALGCGIGVVEPAEHPAVVAFLVSADDRRHPCVADVPRAVRIGREAHPDLVVLPHVRQVR
jgi:hypothetical protein